jgi:hypothetical protein
VAAAAPVVGDRLEEAAGQLTQAGQDAAQQIKVGPTLLHKDSPMSFGELACSVITLWACPSCRAGRHQLAGAVVKIQVYPRCPVRLACSKEDTVVAVVQCVPYST